MLWEKAAQQRGTNGFHFYDKEYPVRIVAVTYLCYLASDLFLEQEQSFLVDNLQLIGMFCHKSSLHRLSGYLEKCRKQGNVSLLKN